MITLGTFNMGAATPEDGPNAFNTRKSTIISQFLKERPTIMGLQEVTASMLDCLKSALPQYTFIGHGREKDYQGEGCPIAYLKDELELHALDTFWLSPSPRVAGSRYPGQSNYPRICTWGRFYHQTSKTLFAFYNTHLDHINSPARAKGLEQVMGFIKEELNRWPSPFFWVGDFNFSPSCPEYTLVANNSLKIKDISTSPSFTYHGFGEMERKQKIDYIFTNVNDQPFPLKTWYKSPDEVFYSDHVALVVDWRV